MILTLWIAIAFAMGMGVRGLGLPPLVGYLTAGFLLHQLNLEGIGLTPESESWLEEIAHLGVLLLMFSIGLKLRAQSLVRTEVIGGGLIHIALSVLFFTPVIYYFVDTPITTAALLASLLTFSSTVLTAKILENKRELRAFHGRVAIGILILQDLVALFIMAVIGDNSPSPWALCLLLIPLVRPLLFRLLDVSGHGELLVLFGLLLAIVIGGEGFEFVGLSSELGAVILGFTLAGHKRAVELSNALWSLKEIFLVGFFLQIGTNGLPDTQALIFAMIMMLLLPLKTFFFFALFVLFKLRARSAFLTSLSLSNYSEFALIAASLLLPQWLVPLAISVAFSFVISAPLNRFAHAIYEKYSTNLQHFERNIRHPDEQPIDLGDADMLIFGMGRTGTAAYDHLKKRNCNLIALDSDPSKVQQHSSAGRNVLFADAEDPLFWQELNLNKIKSVILSMSDVESKVIAAKQLRSRGFQGLVLSHSLYQDEAEMINAAGANKTYLTMDQAGVGLAEHLFDVFEDNKNPSV
jgi:predicted Kef-type K+ transport protein